MSPVNRTGSVSEISLRHSFLRKSFDVFIWEAGLALLPRSRFLRSRASPYEPGNRAGSVTGLNSVVYFSSVDRDEFKKHNQNGGTENCIVRDCHSFVDSCTDFTNKSNSHTPKVRKIQTRPKLSHFGRCVVRGKIFRLKFFVTVTRLESCDYKWISG